MGRFVDPERPGKGHWNALRGANGAVKRRLAVAMVAATAAVTIGLVPSSTAQASTTINVDGNATGRAFQGVGGVSAGAAARLLADYPSAQQNQILDYLFRCDATFCGAALQRLKVEIGGDENSTWGSEASIRRSGEAAPGTSTDSAQCRRGYEFSLIKAAVARNPNIKLDALQWGAPGWIGTSSSPNSPNFWSADNANYVNDFLDCAAQPQNQVGGSSPGFSTVGLWNETPWSAAAGCGGDAINYIKSNLYPTLQQRHPSTGIVATDQAGPRCGAPGSGWEFASNINADSTLANDVAYLGVHYFSGCVPSAKDYKTCQSDLSTAQGLLATHGQYLWSTEHTDDPTTAAGTAKILNRNYVTSQQSATMLCCLLDAYYPSIYHVVGLMSAQSPWGNASYSVLPQVWAVAQTTQFTRIGWHYLDTLGGVPTGAETCLGVSDCTSGSATGSVVTLESPGVCPASCPDFSSVVETTTATANQSLTFALSNVHSLPCGCVHVWKSDLTAGTYLQESDYAVSGGSVTLTASPNSIYTITTTPWGKLGSYSQNPASNFPFPWSDNYKAAGSVAAAKTLDAVATVTGLDNSYNNFTGPIGMVYQAGAAGITVAQLGRYFLDGNNQTHTLSVYLDSNHSLIGSCTLNAATAAVIAGFQYCQLGSPISLAANTKYDITSFETTGADKWYYAGATTVSVASGSVPQAVYQFSGGSWGYTGGVGNTYGPVNFTTAYNNFTGNIGMVYQTGTGNLTLTELGRYFVSGNSHTHILGVYLDSDHSQVGSTCTLDAASAVVNSDGFQYCELSSPTTLAPNTKYDLVTSETTGGDLWYYFPNTTVSVTYGSVPQAVYQFSGGSWGHSGGTGNSYGPVSFTTTGGLPGYLSDQHGAFEIQPCGGGYSGNCLEQVVTAPPICWFCDGPMVGIGSLGTTANNFSGQIGMVYQAGLGGMTLTQLGRANVSGNSQSHTLAVYLDSNHSSPIATCNVDTSTAPIVYPNPPPGFNGFQYCTLSSPIALAAGTKYDFVSSESNGGDSWYYYDGTTVSLEAGSVPSAVYQFSGGSWGYSGGSGNAYGPVDFVVSSRATEPTPTTILGQIASPAGDYTFESQVMWKQAGTASLLTRVNHQDGPFGSGSYYMYSVTDQGAWTLQVISGNAVAGTIASGSVTAPGTGTWHTMEINLSSSTLKVFWDNTSVPIGTATNSSYATGGVGLATGWNKVQFSHTCWTSSIGPC